jgi:hypothetical protein
MWFSRYQPNRARRALTAALAAGLAIIMAPRSSIGGIEAWTTDVPIPQGSWNDFEVQFCGNMTDYIQLSASDANTNPFQNGTLSTSYNPTPTASCPNGTTTATFAGGTGSYGNGSTWETGNRAATSNGKIAHFGILNSASSESTGQNWLEADGVLYIPLPPGVGPIRFPTPNPTPTWPIPRTPVVGPTPPWIISYIQDTTGVGQWSELPEPTTIGLLSNIVDGGSTTASPLDITLTNNGSTPMTFNNYGYFISPTFIPLDNLNFTGEPPPGQPNSPFTVLPTPPSLSAGGSEVVAATPEPSELGLLVLGGLALLARRRWLRAG